MPQPNSERVRKNAERLRSIGWLNFSVTMAAWFFAPDRVDAVVMACLWVVLVLALTQFMAWRLDVRANQMDPPRGLGLTE